MSNYNSEKVISIKTTTLTGPMSQEKFYDDSPEVLEDDRVKPLITKLKALIPSENRPEWDLRPEAWKYGLRNHPDREFVTKILDNNNNGWRITKTPIAKIKCKGSAENYRAKINNIVEGIHLLIKRIEKGYI